MEVTVHEAKTHLSRLLRQVESGEEVLIKRGREPVALLSAVPRPEPAQRNIWGAGQILWIVDDFDEAVPEDLQDYV